VTASVRLWSTTPASNTNLDTGANWPEGMNPSAVNDAARGTQAAVRKMLNDLSAKIIAGGSANAITLTTDSGWVAGDLANGAALMFRAASTNTSATVTIAVDGLTAKNVFREDGTALRIGDIVANGIYIIAYSATAGGFLLLNGTLPSLSGARELLSANRTYYVRTDGSNSNNGLANTSGGAFATIQKAWDTLVTLDLNGFTVTIKLGNSGTFTSGLSATVSPVGGNVIIEGDTSTPANTVISTTNAHAIDLTCVVNLTVRYCELRTTTGGHCLSVNVAGANIAIGAGMRFGACANYHLQAKGGGEITGASNYSIVGAAQVHMLGTLGGAIEIANLTVTVSGTPAFSSSFVYATLLATISAYSITFSGSATGQRYNASLNSAINTYGGGASYFPGNSAGATATGAQYA